MVDRLDVFKFVEFFNEVQDFTGGVFIGHRNHNVGEIGKLGGNGLNPLIAEGLRDRVVIGERAEDLEMIAFVFDIFGTGFEGDFHEAVLIRRARLNDELSFAVELKGNCAHSGEIAAVFTHGAAYFGSGTVFVIGGDFDDDADSGGAVAFVEVFFVSDAGEFAGAFFDSALHVVGGHIGGFRFGDAGAQAGVESRVATAAAGRQGDVFTENAEEFAAFGIGRTLGALDGGPFTVSGHVVAWGSGWRKISYRYRPL